ncbi:MULTISPECIES: substrate-binding periplasmic protein [unclassified Agarivorans]|uniref:substrate-binding periplasmic protein n=1 Tax=unclassified Agarivorans TaxID=2636026 RepID=UPI003D7D77B9
MNNKVLSAIALSLMILLSPLVVAKQINVKKVEGDKELLIFSILKLALSKSSPELSFNQANEEMTESRLINEVIAGNIDVIWGGASTANEEQMRVVRIPVLKGLLGHRIFIIRNGDQHRFDNIKNLSDLKQLKAGQGTFWGDTQVLKTANIPTVTTIKYNNLFPMLEGGRYDYFPRAVHEPWSEVKGHQELNLTVEKNLMLIYPFAMYFYVGKNNQQLHDLIYKGFEMAIEDGSFDTLFFNHPMIKAVLEQANLGPRIRIHIDNPYMHQDTPTDRPEFWLDINKL